MVRDTVARELAHEPLGCRPKGLEVTIRRHRCIDCGHVWRDAVEVVAMYGFTGIQVSRRRALPEAVAVLDPFHVAFLAGKALGECRRRVQQAIHGRTGLERARQTNSQICPEASITYCCPQ
ncbi:hypothetical protein ASG77_20925 [Arthrobacter sp. Soil762]|nr:hypothetical protein ASG77_20925 [Arthrobacter sp. Soil762]